MYRSTLAAWIVVGSVGCSSFDAKNESAAPSTPDAGDDAEAGGPPPVGGTADLSLLHTPSPHGAQMLEPGNCGDSHFPSTTRAGFMGTRPAQQA